jgi:hypothetical protein
MSRRTLKVGLGPSEMFAFICVAGELCVFLQNKDLHTYYLI